MYNTNMLKNKFLSLTLFFLFTFSASFIGGLVSISYKEPWYSQLVKSNFNPPDWVFAPIWISLYLMIAIAAWLIWLSPKKTEKILNIFYIHLLVNASWSIAFFAMHQILASLVIIGIIILFVIWLIKLFYPINKISALLMFPYLAWLCFAFILNFSIYNLN